MNRQPGQKNLIMKLFKLASIALLSTIATFSASAQSFRDAHKQAHQVQKEQLATKNNRLDVKVIEEKRQQEIAAREALEPGLSRESSMLLNDILKEAKTHLGKRYVWGSKGPSTFDCSGFTGYVYRQFGFQIGACSRDQYKYGRPIDRKNVRKGDLIFFTSRSSGGNVGHVGIVWEVNPDTGNFTFIHSSTHRGVVISEFEGYYVNRFVGIKRVIE